MSLLAYLTQTFRMATPPRPGHGPLAARCVCGAFLGEHRNGDKACPKTCEYCDERHTDWLVLDSNEDYKIAGPFPTRRLAEFWVNDNQTHAGDNYQVCSASHWSGK